MIGGHHEETEDLHRWWLTYPRGATDLYRALVNYQSAPWFGGPFKIKNTVLTAFTPGYWPARQG